MEDIELILYILNIIVDAIFIIPVVYLIWDHFKDDKLLTKQVQEFYHSIEHIVYLYYMNILFNINFCDEFWKSNRSKFFKGNFKFLEIEQIFVHRLDYMREKIKIFFNPKENVYVYKYIGMLCKKKVDEKDNEIFYYFSDTNLILTREGEKLKHDYKSLVKDPKMMGHFKYGWEIYNYLGSLRDYWKTNYKKHFIRPRLKPEYKIWSDISFFQQTINPFLKELKENRFNIKSAEYKRRVAEVNKFLEDIYKILRGTSRKGISKGKFRGKISQYYLSKN